MATYTVASGDTLSGISSKLGLSGYNQLSGYDTSNPNLIHPGQVLTYGSPASSSSPTSTPSFSGASGGYSASTPDATLNGYVSSLNQAQNDYQAQSKALTEQLQKLTDGFKISDANAYTGAADYGNLVQTGQALAKGQSALTASQNSQAGLEPMAYAAAAGNNVTSDQAAKEASTSNIPYAEQVAQLTANLVPLENTYNAQQNLVSGEAQGTIAGNQLALQGFTSGMQAQLSALQSKVDTGQQLTNDEYNSYTSLKTAETQAAAQVQAAQISAGGAVQAANISASASKYANALANPGIKVSFDANGNPNGISYLNQTTGSSQKTPNGTDIATLKTQIAQNIVSNPDKAFGGAQADAIAIANIQAQSGMSNQEAASLYYGVRNDYNSINPSAPSSYSLNNPFAQAAAKGSLFPAASLIGK